MQLLARVTAVALLVSPLVSSIGYAQSVWVAPSTHKVRPGDAAGSGTSISLEAAGNEFEAFHVVVNGGTGGAKAISATASKLTGPGGATISDVRVYREAFYSVATQSNANGAAGLWPDAMIPAVDELDGQTRNAFPYDVAANTQQPLFIEYHVPPNATPGYYNGTVTVSGGASATVSVKLYVHAFSLPSTSSMPTAFGIGWDDACVAAYGSYTACGGDAGVIALNTKYAKFALDHRVSLSEVVYSGPSQNSDGSYDWTSWDGIYGPMLDGGMGGRLAGAKLTSVRYEWTVDQAHYAEWANHFASKGWLDRTFDYTCDEPPNGCAWNTIAPRAAMVHAANPNFQTLVTTSISLATSNSVLSSIDTLVPVIDYLDPSPPATNTRAQYDSWLGGSNKRVWTYQSCDEHGCNVAGGDVTGWVSYMIDAPATLNRAMAWQDWRQKVSGELYYDTTYAFTRGDAWSNQYYFAGNGDGTLFYPGTPAKIGGTSNIPIASLRLKMIREGQEDYEYFKLLADAGDATMADTEAAGLSPNAYNDVSDPSLVDASRHRMALRIEALTQQSPPPMTDTPDGGAGGSGGAGGGNGGVDGGAGGTGSGSGSGAGNGVGGNGVGGNGATPAGATQSTAVHGGCSHGGHAPQSPFGLVAVVLFFALALRRRRAG
jgi:MYXO-CTERM domain-containing protein